MTNLPKHLQDVCDDLVNKECFVEFIGGITVVDRGPADPIKLGFQACYEAMVGDVEALLSSLGNYSAYNNEPQKGLDPTFYLTLSYEDDLELHRWFAELKEKYEIK